MALTVRSDAGGTFGAVQFNAEDILLIDGAKTKAAPGKTLEASGAAVATVGGSYSINDSGGTPMVSITDAKRFQADFSNATTSNRLMFQTSVANQPTWLSTVPNGTNKFSGFIGYGNSDVNNASWFGSYINESGGVAVIASDKGGTGAYFPIAFQTGGAERMRIDTAGIGTFQSGFFANEFKCPVAGFATNTNSFQISGTGGARAFAISVSPGNQLTFYCAGNTAGAINNPTATTTAYGTSSDYRLKKNVRAMVAPLARLLRLKPVAFDWKFDDSEGEGFIAHELQEEVPLAVFGEKDAVETEEDMPTKIGEILPQSVDFGKIVPLVVAAVQELTAELRDEIDKLKMELALLKDTLQ